MKSYDIDLKWALWVADPGYFEERAPEAYHALLEAWTRARSTGQCDEFQIFSAPKKEIRYGLLTIFPNGAYEVNFKACWDSLHDLVGTVCWTEFGDEDLLPPHVYDRVVDALKTNEGLWSYMDDNGELGTEIDGGSKLQFHETFEDFLKTVDALEDELFQREKEAWDDVAKIFVAEIDYQLDEARQEALEP